MMEQRTCKNKKCGRVLPEGYKHKYCEKCRNAQADAAKKGILGTLGTVLSIGLFIVTAGKFKPKD